MSSKALTYKEQIDKLKLKGMTIDNESEMYKVLSNFNYTKAISPLKEIWAEIQNTNIEVENREYNLFEVEKLIKSSFKKDENNSHIYTDVYFNDNFVYKYLNNQKKFSMKLFEK